MFARPSVMTQLTPIQTISSSCPVAQQDQVSRRSQPHALHWPRLSDIGQCFGTITDKAFYQRTDLSQTWRLWQFQVCTQWGFFMVRTVSYLPLKWQ